MKILFTICLSLSTLLSFSQFRESFFALDANWQQTEEKHAKYLLWIHKDSAGNWEYSYYHMWGPMIKQESFKDHDGTMRNGLCTYYYTSGNLDSVAHYKDGKREGKFIRYAFLPNDSLSKMTEYDYANDSLIKTVDYRSAGIKDSSLKLEAQYPGGDAQWMQYLNKNLHYPDRAASNEKQGNVRILFTINEQGTIIDPMISKSVEYSLDRESLRIISSSGSWEPAIMQAVPVSSELVKTISFKLVSN